MPVDPAQLDDLFAAALAEPDAVTRTVFLDQACAGNPELRERLEALLAAHEAAGSFLHLPADESTTHFVPLSEYPGTTIGRYKLLEKIGQGGFGVVFMAEQERPVRRRVALKVIKLGMDTNQVVARFEAERQALAMMDHPNIAKVFDAGATDAGRPYFVMELVRGVPITEYCDTARLSTIDRLALFQSVCSAVQHAHQKGIIHRDLKPSNVLVTLHDDKAVPKVIDFGVAKATQARLTERTLFTEFRQMIGTPSYMSPEQAQMSGLDIDTRSDVYSLGVLLYELLTGTTPIDAKQLGSSSYDDLRRLICEVEPPSPSQRLSSLSADQVATLARERRCESTQLAVHLRSDLDWIAMKCLEKDRKRRYESASALALDLQRYLDGEPVEARPPTRRYRLSKFAQRNKPVLVTATLVAAALTFGTVASTWQAIRASRAQTESLAQAHEALQSEAQTRAVLDFVENRIFAAARPEGLDGGLGHDVTLRRAVSAALPFVETSFTDQPLIEARLRHTLGLSFWYLGEADKAAEQFQKSRKSYSKHLGPDHPDTLRCTHGLANCYADLGRYAEALKLREETLALRKAKLGVDHRDTLTSMNNLAVSYAALGLTSEALRLRNETFALQKAKLGPDHLDTLHTMNSLAISYSEVGQHAEALEIEEETLARQKVKLGPDHPDTLVGMTFLATIYSTLGRHAEALKLREETLALRKAKLGPEHRDTLNSMNTLARGYTDLGRHAEALELEEETFELQKAKLGPDHYDTLLRMNALAWDLATCTDPQLRDPSRAADLAKRAAELNSTDNFNLFRAAIVLLETGSEEEFRRHCHRYLELAIERREFQTADMAAKASLLLPVDGADFERACEMADFAAANVTLAEEPERIAFAFWAHLVVALADYRQNRYAVAKDHTQFIVTAEDASPECKAAAWFIQACVYARLHQIESARKALGNGDQLVTRAQPLQNWYSWHDWAIASILRRQTEELIKKESAVAEIQR